MSKRQGKGARKRAKERRAAQKRAIKAQRQAEYAAMAGTGKNKKKKKNKSNAGAAVKHPLPYCGNLACKRCHKEVFLMSLAKPNSCEYSKNFTNPQLASA